MSTNDAIALAIVILLVLALFVGLRVWRKDPLMRRVRFGVFLERDRFEEPDLEHGWDEDVTEEISPLRHRLKLPEEDK